MDYLELLHRCAAPAWDKQMALRDLIKDEPRWDSDLSKGVLIFGKRIWNVQVLGSESDQSDTWLWGWANTESNLPPNSFTAAKQLRAYGEQHDIPELTHEYHERSALINGHTLSMIASMICGGNAYYRAPYEGGAVFLLIQDAAYPRQDYDPIPRIPMNVPDVLRVAPLYDHRLVLFSYLDYYQAKIEETPLELIGTFANGRTVSGRFDGLGRLVSIKAE